MGTPLTTANVPGREVKAFDATFSAPKSVSLLWAFGTQEVTSVIQLAHVEAVNTALSFLEDHAAVARQQKGGVRERVKNRVFRMTLICTSPPLPNQWHQ